MSEAKPSPVWRFTERGAIRADAAAIARLIDTHAADGGTLARDADEVADSIGEFVVVEGRQKPSSADASEWIAACGALVMFSPALAEIRSVAVDPASQGQGFGRRIVERLVAEAAMLEIDRVVLLTREPGFFRRCGFSEVDEAFLPVDFLEEMIVARGRTCAGRAIMLRSLS
ncbi:MAG: GNAT family N-acetyltransferase [Planctomycetota bacterium]